MDECEAIFRLKTGDLNGLEWLVTEFQVEAIRTSFLITGDVQMAEDIVQDEFLRFNQHRNRFDTSRPFKPWFLRCVINSTLKKAKKEHRYAGPGNKWDDRKIEEILSSNELSPEEQVLTFEFRDRVWAAIQMLSPKERSVIVQRYFLGMSEKEMSTNLGNAPGTIKWLLNAARQKMKSLLRPERNLE